VTITFGSAAGDADVELRALTAAADAALLTRKSLRPAAARP
jgi:hypothetical protein